MMMKIQVLYNVFVETSILDRFSSFLLYYITVSFFDRIYTRKCF